MKIRIGNDFVFNWAIERGGLPEDLSSVLEKHLHLSVFGKRVELVEGVDYDIIGNVIRIEVTPAIANIIGTYKVEFYYTLPDNGLIDEDRKCAVDVDAFQIVARTAQADDPSEFTVTSDMAIAFKGDKGDSAYQVWLEEGNIGTEEDYFAFLRQPAVDAGASISELEGEIQVSEGLRVQAESERDLAEGTRVQSESERLAAEIIRQSNEGNRIESEDTRVQNEAERISEEGIRQSNETDRVEAEGVRAQAEIERVQAESEREQAEGERQTTIQEAVTATNLANEKANIANTAAQSANEAAELADTARTELTTAVNTKLGEADDKIEEMDTTLSTYDGRVTQVESDITQLESEVSVKLNNLTTNGNFANGTTGWVPTVSTLTVTDGELNVKSTRTSSGPAYVSQDNQIIGNNIYYASFKYISEIVPLGLYTNDNIYHTLRPPVAILTPFSIVFNPTNNTTGLRFRITDDSPFGNEFSIKDVLLINLTTAFGVGNEPTKEEMDLLISTLGIDYFEGEVTIPAQKVMQWQLKMIRQNRSAIIALGGTIV